MAFENTDADMVYSVNNYATQNDYDHQFLSSEPNVRFSDESSFWPHSPKSESNLCLTDFVSNPYKIYSPNSHRTIQSYSKNSDQIAHSFGEFCQSQSTPGVGRVVKRRCTANKKERRRTQSINNAYADLRDCIPNVPTDTKLSKIKTLRLATLYISYLIGVLEMDDPSDFGAFKAELGPDYRRTARAAQESDCGSKRLLQKNSQVDLQECGRKRPVKGRTGWPQHVWALELKQDQNH